MPGQVLLQRDGGLARVVLSHAGRLNAMSRAMWIALREVFTALQQDLSVRCVLLEGEGDAFCAGGDIAEYADFRFQAQGLRHFHEVEVWGGLQAILDCDAPVLAVIRGACMGAGVEIASCCDVRIAAAGARFGAPIAKLGFPMAPREAQLVARAAGEATARQLLLEAAVLDAPTLHARGFLQHLADEDELAERAAALARRIASLAPQAARLNKQMLRALREQHGTDPQRREAARRVIEGAYDYAPSDEHREGVGAFMDKRTPSF